VSYPKDELVVPEAAHGDEHAMELLRIWIAGAGQHVSMRTMAWEDPAHWGHLLAGLARHIARTYHDQDGRNIAEAMRCIRRGFEDEVNRPTDEPSARVSA
jgi:hypothetical protein